MNPCTSDLYAMLCNRKHVLTIYMSELVSEWLFFNPKWAIFIYIIARTIYISINLCPLCIRSTCL